MTHEPLDRLDADGWRRPAPTLRTWHAEFAAVAVVLFGTAALTGSGVASWLSACAVLGTFAHAQVADRLAEREAARPVVSVECHAMAARYLVAKELLWVAVFVGAGLWPALVGCAVFLAYPFWRRFYRRFRPIGRLETA